MNRVRRSHGACSAYRPGGSAAISSFWMSRWNRCSFRSTFSSRAPRQDWAGMRPATRADTTNGSAADSQATAEVGGIAALPGEGRLPPLLVRRLATRSQATGRAEDQAITGG